MIGRSVFTAEAPRRRGTDSEKLLSLRLRVSAVSAVVIKRYVGFTLIELLLALLLVALLASLVAPVVTGSIYRAREATLKEDLQVMRKAIDDHYADTGTYPAELEELVKKRYVRRIPIDPVTEKRDSWLLTRAEEDKSGKGAGIIDVHSSSEEKASDGTYYKEW